MPHIRARGMKREELLTISGPLIAQLVEWVEVPEDHFTLEHVTTEFIKDSAPDPNAYPFFEVWWFSRQPQLAKKIAGLIDDLCKPFGYATVTVVFFDLNPADYYENGAHF